MRRRADAGDELDQKLFADARQKATAAFPLDIPAPSATIEPTATVAEALPTVHHQAARGSS
jgi:hypothetical protein